ncbi:MAG: insulinase family protein [Cypionkella sp.]|nr:insulinase family protein [Cypionkella sp.]
MFGSFGRGAVTLATLGFCGFAIPAMGDTVSTFRLENGLQIVVIEDHRAPVVTQMVWYKIGAADESPGHSGIAHFLEHLMFKGTDKVPPGQFSARVEAQGGNDNAFTTSDYTAYFQRVAADRLDLMMEMESDRMRNLRLTEEDVKTERDVILEERAQRTDSDPGSLLNEQMAAAQFLNSPYGIPVIGWRREMAQLSRQDALDFYQANYAPNNAILVVAGDVQPDAVLSMAQKYYGPVAPSDKIKPRVRPQEPPQLAERRMVLADERVSEPYLVRTYLAPNRHSGDQKEAAALTLLAELLGGSGTTSVFARALQFDTQTAVWSSAFYDATTVDPDTFGVALGPVPGVSLAEAEAAMDKVIAKFLKDGVDAKDFARIKTQIRADDIYARDDSGGLARKYGAALAVGLTIEDEQSWSLVLQSVTEDEVMAVARKVLTRDNAVTGWLTPKAEAQQ